MNIHEFQGKLLLKQYNVPVQEGVVIDKDDKFDELNKLKNFHTKESVFAVKA